MKKYFDNFLLLALNVLAMVAGGGIMAVADLIEPQIGNEGPTPAPNTDPADPNTNDRLAPGGNLAGQDLTGTQASSTQLTKGGMVEDEWDSNIVKFNPWKSPLLSIARQVTKRVNVRNWSIKHMRVGGDTLDGVTTANIATADTITLTPSNFSGSLRPFYKCSTVFVEGVKGYKRGSTTETEGQLMLFVVESSKDSVKLKAVNGPAKVEGESGDDLEYYTVPAIPAGTTLSCGASAASESQLIIAPENFQPREKEVYVQKKLLNIVMTEDFDKVKKKQPLRLQDIKEDALCKYNIRAERTYWKGVKSRFNVQNSDGSEEFVYTSEGILSQLTNLFSIGDTYQLSDLVAISKLQFTDFSDKNHAYAFCGKNAIERLLNINLGEKQREIFTDTTNFNIDFKRFKTTFGSIDFVYDQTLDMLGYADCMVILDLESAVRYVKITEKERTNDMSKGAGEVRDAKRFIHEEADCVALRGYNSILVGPRDIILGFSTTQTSVVIETLDSVPQNPYTGQLISLTEDDEENGLESGVVYIYNGESWVEYHGPVHAD